MSFSNRHQNSYPLQRQNYRSSSGLITPLSPPPSPIQHGVHNPRPPRINRRSAAGSNSLRTRGVQFPLPKVVAKPSTARKRALQQQSVRSASRKKTNPQAQTAQRHTPRATGSAPQSGGPTRSCAEPCGTASNIKGVGYRKPLDASAALDNLRTTEATAEYIASFNAYATTGGQCLSWTHSPTFPFLEYASEPDIPPTYSGIDVSYRTYEVYALPASQHLFSTNSTTRCGSCSKPLRWGVVLPSRCQQPSCHVVNVGNDWAANEKFRQAEFRDKAITRQDQESRNYRREGIKYEALIKWRQGGARRSEDPVHWQDFMQCHVLQDWAAQEKDRDQGEVDVRYEKRSGTGKVGSLPDAPPASQLHQPIPASDNLCIDPFGSAQDGGSTDLALGGPVSEKTAAPVMHASDANGSADFLINAFAGTDDVFDFSNLLDDGGDFCGGEMHFAGQHPYGQQQQRGEETRSAQNVEGNDTTPVESFTDLLYEDTNLSFFDFTSPAQGTADDTSHSSLNDKRVISELPHSEPGFSNPPFNQRTEHHLHLLRHTPSSSSDPIANESQPNISGSTPPVNLDANQNSSADFIVRSYGTAELLPPIAFSNSSNNLHRGVSTGSDIRKPTKRPFSDIEANPNPVLATNPSLILRRDGTAEFVQPRGQVWA